MMVMCLRLRRLSVIVTLLPRPMVFGPSDKVIRGDESSSFRSAFNGIRYATCEISRYRIRGRDVQFWVIRVSFRLPERSPLRKASTSV